MSKLFSFRRNPTLSTKQATQLAEQVRDLLTGKPPPPSTEKVLAPLKQRTTFFQVLDVLRAMNRPSNISTRPQTAAVIPQGDTYEAVPMEGVNPQTAELVLEPGLVEAIEIMAKFPPPRLDAVTVRIHWWGYQVFLPSAMMKRLDDAKASADSVIAFLQVLGDILLVIKPFVGILAAYVQLEYRVIRQQDQGQGVVISALWVLPVVYFPRSWDVPVEVQK